MIFLILWIVVGVLVTATVSLHRKGTAIANAPQCVVIVEPLPRAPVQTVEVPRPKPEDMMKFLNYIIAKQFALIDQSALPEDRKPSAKTYCTNLMEHQVERLLFNLYRNISADTLNEWVSSQQSSLALQQVGSQESSSWPSSESSQTSSQPLPSTGTHHSGNGQSQRLSKEQSVQGKASSSSNGSSKKQDTTTPLFM